MAGCPAWRIVGVVALGVLSGAAASAQVPAGAEFQVSTYTTYFQVSPSVAADDRGGLVIAWASYQNATEGMYGQRFGPTGAPAGGEFQIVQSPSTYLFHGGAFGDRRGNFTGVWANTSISTLFDVFARRYDAAGLPTGAGFMVNTFVNDDQVSPRGTTDRFGNTVIVWSSDGQDGSSMGVFGQRFDAAGARRGTEFQVNTYTTGYQGGPSVDADAEGNFVVVWDSYFQDGDGFGAFGQRFSAAGVRQGAEFRVNVYTTGRQDPTGVAMDKDGNFVVAWSGSPGLDGDNFGVFARRFDRDGTPLSGDIRVNTYTTGSQIDASIDGDANGNFIVAWRSIGQDAGTEGVFAQRFDSAGARRGGEFRVNTYTTENQNEAAVGSDSSGNFVVAWQSRLQDGSDYGIFAQRFGGLLPAALVVDATAGPTADGNGILEPGETVAVAPSWRNVNGAAQAFSGAASAFTGPGTPGNPAYTIVDGAASYGSVANGATATCAGAADCYAVGTSVASPRPLTHWDATLREDILPAAQGQSRAWALHVGDSFLDVPRVSGFYRFIETLLHRGITAGCSATQYCPLLPTTREQMAVFVLVAKDGAGYVPPSCGSTPMFADVPVASPFCRWIEELARRAVVAGCGGGNYCPALVVSREQMPVFVLKTLDPAINPPACGPTPIYADVPAASGFCRWIEELTRRAVVTGCGGGNYCPRFDVTREQMGVFVSATFGLTLYGP